MNLHPVARPCFMMNESLAGFCCGFSRLTSHQIYCPSLLLDMALQSLLCNTSMFTMDSRTILMLSSPEIQNPSWTYLFVTYIPLLLFLHHGQLLSHWHDSWLIFCCWSSLSQMLHQLDCLIHGNLHWQLHHHLCNHSHSWNQHSQQFPPDLEHNSADLSSFLCQHKHLVPLVSHPFSH